MDNLLPWYLRFWKEEILLVAVSATSFYIASLHNVIKNDNLMLDAAHTQMTKMTAEYKADIGNMTNTIKTQDAAIAALEAKSAEDTRKADLATAKSNSIRYSTNKAVNDILSRPVAQGCESSIEAAIKGAATLKWGNKK